MPLAITPTFSPRTHTSDDSYIYQLSLVLATAIVSFVWKDNFAASRFHCHRYKRPVLNDIYSYLTPNHTRSALSNTVGKSVSLAFSWCYEYPPLLRLYEPAWSMYVCGSYLVQFVVNTMLHKIQKTTGLKTSIIYYMTKKWIPEGYVCTR